MDKPYILVKDTYEHIVLRYFYILIKNKSWIKYIRKNAHGVVKGFHFATKNLIITSRLHYERRYAIYFPTDEN